MPELRHLLSPDSELALEAVRYMSPDPEVVVDMTREQLYIHLDVRAKVLAAQSNDWREVFEAEAYDKISLWSAGRDLHEAIKRAKQLEGPAKHQAEAEIALRQRRNRQHAKIIRRHENYRNADVD